ncbi:MAG TPA: polysaccharide biosynthesis/export family protein [Bacteroidota bacterium]|nr:polysaccharide biosynthesis/export family protein [Bacteroidota bacterium]
MARILFPFLISLLIHTGCGSSKVMQESSAVSRSSAGALGETGVKTENKTSVIKSGDHIEITVWGYTEFNTKGTVTEEGFITIPLIGDIKAEGLTKDQLLKELRSNLADYIQGESRITISITSPSNQRITVLGAVTRQDNYPVTAEVSLLEVLSAAGGGTPEADLHHIRVLRNGNGENAIVVNLAWFIENGRAENMPKVRPGDTVFVPKKENFVREFSEFLRDAVLVFGFFRVFY